MIDKIKSVLGEIGAVLVAVLLGVLYAVIQKNRRLETEVKSSKEEEALKELTHDQVKIDSDASADIAQYYKLRDDYLSGSDKGLRSGDSGAEGSSGDQGSGNNPGPGPT